MTHEDEKLGAVYDATLVRRLIPFIKPYARQSVFAVITLLIASVLAVLTPKLIQVGIDDYIATDDLDGLGVIIMVFSVVLIAGFGFRYAQMYIMEWIGQQIMFDLRRKIFGHLQHLSLSFFNRNPVGRLMTRVTSDVQALNDLFTSGFIAIFGDIFMLAGILIFMFEMNWRLTLLTMATLPLLFLATFIFKRKVRNAFRDIRIRIAKINANMQENISGMTVVQLFNREAKNFNIFDDLNRDHLDAYRRTILYFAIFYPVVELIGALSTALIVWYGGLRVMDATLSFGELVAFLQYAIMFYRPIADLSEKFNILQSAMASSERIFKLLDEKPESGYAKNGKLSSRRPDSSQNVIPVQENTSSHVIPPQAGVQKRTDGLVPKSALTDKNERDANGAFKLNGAIHFSNVWFAYKEENWVLRDVSFDIKPGEKIGVVGATGAGKTTIINLLSRFYNIQKGGISLDGRDIYDFSLNTLRQNIGVVLQDVFLFAGSIAENIRLGNNQISDEQMRQAALDVSATEFIEKLPGQFDHHLIERGATLSSGQKQLLSFARALAFDPAILILDEATSNVDTETELLIQNALKRLMANRTSIVIAHRLATLQNVDRIFVMHKGELREAGTHEELLALGGIYSRLYALQFSMQAA